MSKQLHFVNNENGASSKSFNSKSNSLLDHRFVAMDKVDR